MGAKKFKNQDRWKRQSNATFCLISCAFSDTLNIHFTSSCQFIVKEAANYDAHLNDPDMIVDWDLIKQVNLKTTSDVPSCPIWWVVATHEVVQSVITLVLFFQLVPSNCSKDKPMWPRVLLVMHSALPLIVRLKLEEVSNLRWIHPKIGFEKVK